MGSEVDLLRSIPRPKRNLSQRSESRSQEIIAESKKYGQMYFDGPRDYGYGGYRYDGRWKSVAVDIIEHFNLVQGSRVLDVGAAKGFLVKELLDLGIDAYGVDISEYAVMNCHPDVVGRMHVASADHLCFPDQSFAAVLAIDVIHNLPRQRAAVALREVQRLSNGRAYVRVDSYRTPEEKQVFEGWVLTAEYHGYPQEWLQLFSEAGYSGDYSWTIIQ
ncbi:MAG: class I SAM-dependent methyltransferase [Actinobacteria bacterium]|nr:class I SAM-dependent methyltransferase [Actinomycetota bacterium]NDF84488.1 class I SAM-dependent methyltransferase [Actinomycetota bacterium]